MSLRANLRWLGVLTLLGVPLPSIVVLYFFEKQSLAQIFQSDNIQAINLLLGLATGILCAILIYWATRHPVFKNLPLKVEEMILEAGLKPVDAVFLSFAAGFGEELLFRTGVQYYLGVIPTSIVFVAIHGYFSIKNPKMSLYGLLVLPFILILGFGFIHFGLWFSIAAHFSYDLLLFLLIIYRSRDHEFEF